MYGCHDLRRDDRDANAATHTPPRWGGVNNAPAFAANCPGAPNAVAPNAPNALALPEHVRLLQEHLRALGFSVIRQVTGIFDRDTQWAVREFQIYAKMTHVARIRPAAAPAQHGAAHLVAQQGQSANESVYVASLERIENGLSYTGPVSGVVNADTRAAIEHWLANEYRCPVIIEAWRVAGGQRTSLFPNGVNLWHHDHVASSAPRMFVRDFTQYYTFPVGHPRDDMHVVGDFTTYMSWAGPRSAPPQHTWRESEMLPLSLVGNAALQGAAASTFRVVRAVAEVECLGFFDSLNSYDNAFLSAGPCHWTVGIVNNNSVDSGEFCGFLAYLAHADSNAFEDAVGFFGLRVDKDWVDGQGVGNGAPLFSTAGRKYSGWVALQRQDGTYHAIPKNEAEGNYLKTWHWYYRLLMAGRTIDGYRQRMWHMARIRLRDIRDVRWGAGVANVPDGSPQGRAPTIGDVLTSERAMAILLRWHVRFPGHVVAGGQAAGHVRSALTLAKATQPNLNWQGAPTTWGDDHESALVQGLRDEVVAVGNAGLVTSIGQVDQWPTWNAAANPRHYALTAPLGPLNDDRSSFDFDDSDLPPAP